ncbi:hypothetical protein FB480_101284 [Agrobacterium vitis]|nr:hypothetical protein FB480_101284 [Agrobacterium vitis]
MCPASGRIHHFFATTNKFCVFLFGIMFIAVALAKHAIAIYPGALCIFKHTTHFRRRAAQFGKVLKANAFAIWCPIPRTALAAAAFTMVTLFALSSKDVGRAGNRGCDADQQRPVPLIAQPLLSLCIKILA